MNWGARGRGPGARVAAIAAIAILLSSCGYHVSGHANLMPKTIKVIAIPAFQNGTTNHRLPVLLMAEVTREFISRTHYTVVTNPDQADATLLGTVARFDIFPIIFDPVSGRATSVQIVVTMQLNLTDRHTGKVLYSRVGAEFRERYEISIDPQQYFDESGTAIERVSRDVARSVVSGILENF
jgi:Lipopolysaccharide-assembly